MLSLENNENKIYLALGLTHTFCTRLPCRPV
jgi:hypothetical protein